MDHQSHTELQATQIAFYRLQQNFNHNVLVIDQLEEENKRLTSQNESIKTQYHQAVDQMQGMMQQVNKQNVRLNELVKSQVQRVRQQCDEQIQRIVQMMKQKMMESKKYELKKFNREKNDIQIEAQRFEDSLRHFSLENSQLIETIKQLRLQKQNLEDQLSILMAQKESYSNKFLLHEKELESMRNANEELEQILKQAKKEKQKVEEELSQVKLGLQSIKQEASKKIEEIEICREKLNRAIVEDAKQIKFKDDSIVQEVQKLRVQNKIYEQEIQQLQLHVQQLSRQAGSEKEIQYLKKMFEQEKRQIRGEQRAIESQRDLMKQELKQVNERRNEVEKNVERLKIAIDSAQKQIAHCQSQIKKLQTELKQKTTQPANYPNYSLQKSESFEDRVNQHYLNKANEYLKNFSGDTGSIGSFRIDSSISREIQESSKPTNPHSNSPNFLLMKKIGQLQAELEQCKIFIKSQSLRAQQMRQQFSHKVGVKEKQIKLCHDEIYVLREKINDREQQLLTLNNVRQQLDEKNRRIDELSNKNMKIRDSLDDKFKIHKELEKQIKMLCAKCEEMEQKLKINEEQRLILDSINEHLRDQIYQFKNRVKVYDQQSQDQSQSQQEFQQMEPNQQIIDKQQKYNPIKTKSDTSQSKSGQKTKIPPMTASIENRTSMKFKDFDTQKKQFEMENKNIEIQSKEPNNYKNVEKTGIFSQKEVLENRRKRSKDKEYQAKETINRIKAMRETLQDEEELGGI